MDQDTARWLVSDAAAPVLAAAAAEADPGSLAAATRLRALVDADQAAAVSSQIELRRAARGKFGADAERWYFTRAGVEQATRPAVAARRAARMASAGASRVADLGCGLGADARAFAAAGIGVTAVELDPVTAIFASANLGLDVAVADAEQAWGSLACGDPELAVFADPARRTAAGRTWRIEDFSPPWPFVLGLAEGSRVACLKLGPGVPHRLLPAQADVEWVSDAGTVVECALWAGPGSQPGRRAAVVDGVELAGAGAGPAPVAQPCGYLYEPDGAVVRAGLTDELAGLLRAHRLDEHAAYLSAPHLLPTPFATAFAVSEVLPYDESALRGWVRANGVGVLEIKKRGLDVDPAALRRRLKPRGKASATLVLTPTPAGAVAVVCHRV